MANWRTWRSIEEAVEMAEALDALLPEARRADSGHAITLLELIQHLRNGAFLTTKGMLETPTLLSRVDLIIADLLSRRRETLPPAPDPTSEKVSRAGSPGNGGENEVPPVQKAPRRPRTADGGRRPSPEAIGQIAKAYLVNAMDAAKSAGEPYVPSRECIAAAVSKALGRKIGIESLFGTKADGSSRAPRYPKFAELWKKVQTASKEARRKRKEAP